MNDVEALIGNASQLMLHEPKAAAKYVVGSPGVAFKACCIEVVEAEASDAAPSPKPSATLLGTAATATAQDPAHTMHGSAKVHA